MSISLRIKELRKQKKLSQVDFSAQIGVTQASISHYESGDREPDTTFLNKVYAAYNVNLNWLLTGTGPMFLLNERARVAHHANDAKPAFLHLPVVADIAAGNGIEAFDVEPEEYLDVPRSFLSIPGPYLAFHVCGDSMSPWICPGDYAVVSESWHDLDFQDHICAFRTLDGLILKRFHVAQGGKSALLMPLNPAHPVLKYTKNDPDYTLLGLLVVIIRKLL